MEARPLPKAVRINRFLPYWAVFQADQRQLMSSWVYRTWVLVSLLVGVGYTLYRLGAYQETGTIQQASHLMSDLLRWTVLGSVTLIIMMTVGSISGDRGPVADSVLSRGISRFQFFLAKWHARLVTILGTFLAMGVIALAGSFFLRHEDLSLLGSIVALLTVAAILATVISCGVAASALTNSTVLGMAVLWLVIYGAGIAMSVLPEHYPAPDRALSRLKYVLQGSYNLEALGRLVGWSVMISCSAALVGMLYFSRKDV